MEWWAHATAASRRDKDGEWHSTPQICRSMNTLTFDSGLINETIWQIKWLIIYEKTIEMVLLTGSNGLSIYWDVSKKIDCIKNFSL